MLLYTTPSPPSPPSTHFLGRRAPCVAITYRAPWVRYLWLWHGRPAVTHPSLYSRISPSGYSPLGNTFDSPIREGPARSAFFFCFRFLASPSNPRTFSRSEATWIAVSARGLYQKTASVPFLHLEASDRDLRCGGFSFHSHCRPEIVVAVAEHG